MLEGNDRCRGPSFGGLRIWYWVTAIVLASSGCAPAGSPPAQGQISLKFEGTSNSDANFSELVFTLANGLDRPIYIRGDRTFSRAIRMLRPDANISCTAADSGSPRTEVGLDFGFADREAKLFDVSPGKRVKLVIPTQPQQRYKSGRCYIELVSKDGTTVGPIEFNP